MMYFAFDEVKISLTRRMFNQNTSEADKIQDEMASLVG